MDFIITPQLPFQKYLYLLLYMKLIHSLTLYSSPNTTPPISTNMNFTQPTTVQKHGSISTSGKFSLTTGGPQVLFSFRIHRALTSYIKQQKLSEGEKKKSHIIKGHLFHLHPLGIQSAINEGEKEDIKPSPTPVKNTVYPIHQLEINLQFPL